MTKRNDERGVAVALVMLVLALVTLAATGLVLQSRMDTKYNRALGNYDKMFNLADAGAVRAFYQIQLTESVGFTGESVYTTVETGAPPTMGQWQAKIAIKGYSTDPQDTPGWELGQDSGYHVQVPGLVKEAVPGPRSAHSHKLLSTSLP